ncbi:MAG: DNA repair protein RecO [Akkermansiaceae bacterium]|nr:DNA repair protein RecO [Akkermansiaceae bacterium]
MASGLGGSGLVICEGFGIADLWGCRFLLAAMEKAEGIIIRLTKLTDSSLIVLWCTEEAGLLKTVAKGARRAKSAFAGKLDLFVQAELEWVRSRKSDLHILREVVVSDYRVGLRKRYASTVLAAYFGQLLEQLVEREHPEPELFDLLRRGLGHLETVEASRKMMLHYEREMARLLGVAQEGQNAAAALERAFGGLPKARQNCLDLLSAN